MNDLRAKNLDFRMTMAPADSTLRKNAVLSHKKAEVKPGVSGLGFGQEEAHYSSSNHA
jgi:hypothetical protein